MRFGRSGQRTIGSAGSAGGGSESESAETRRAGLEGLAGVLGIRHSWAALTRFRNPPSLTDHSPKNAAGFLPPSFLYAFGNCILKIESCFEIQHAMITGRKTQAKEAPRSERASSGHETPCHALHANFVFEL